MRFSITMKDPDGPYECLLDGAKQTLPAGLSDAERDAVVDIRVEEMKKFASKWLRYGEYVTLIFDTDAGTVEVEPTT